LVRRLGYIKNYIPPDQYAKVAALVQNFDETTPTKIANLNDPVSQDAVHYATTGSGGIPRVRGKPTLGKAMLAGTSGAYILPRAKFDRLGRLSKRMEKYRADQTRDARGRFADEGKGRGKGGAAVSSKSPVNNKPPGHYSNITTVGSKAVNKPALERRFQRFTSTAQNGGTRFEEFRGGTNIEIRGPGFFSVFVPATADKPITFNSLMTTSGTQDVGRDFARESLRTVLELARKAEASSIDLEAVHTGAYIWPKIGFELSTMLDDGGRAAAGTFVHGRQFQDRLERAREVLSWSQRRLLAGELRKLDAELPMRLANLDFNITADQMKHISYGRANLGKPTLGKALLMGVSGNYTLPKSKWHLLERYVSRV
jgi:hypothetical protein